MRIERIDAPADEWNDFVRNQSAVQLGHAAQWHRILPAAYGVETIALAARAPTSGEIRGVLSLARFRGLRGRSELVSLPYLDASGVLAADDDAKAALIDAALELTRETGAGALELRSIDRDAPTPDSGAEPTASANRVDLRLQLESDEEAQWSAVGAKVRNQTRKATKQGLDLGEAHGLDALDAFYDPFCFNMRDLGSPVHSRRLFEQVIGAFGEAARVITCHGGGPSVGGLIALEFAGVVHVPWASTLRSERKRCPNNLIYWEALRWAIERGAREFDFGRSPVGEGTYRFKKGWGAKEVALEWTRFHADGQPIPVPSIGDAPGMQKLSEIWSRLPLGLTRVLGPLVRRRLSA